MPRLRRADCSSPGIRRVRRGRGFSYVDDTTGEPIADVETLERIRELTIPPAWQDVWICPLAERPHPGDRHRRPRAQAVPLPRPLAGATRPREIRPDARVRARAAAAAPSDRRAPAPPTADAGARPGGRGPAARPRFLPDRRRELRRGERHVRPRDDAEAPRPPRAPELIVFDYVAKGGKRRVQSVVDPQVYAAPPS